MGVGGSGRCWGLPPLLFCAKLFQICDLARFGEVKSSIEKGYG